MQKINVDLYGGKSIFGGRETPVEADEIYCDKTDQCTYYQSGTCLRCRRLFATTCMYGRNNIIKGYTSRARKYNQFKNTYKNDEVYSKLEYPDELVAIIGDNLYMHYKFGTVRERTESDERWVKDVEGYVIDTGCYRSSVFIPLNEVTNTLLFAIFSNKPRAMLGGVIEEYQDKIVPDIIQTLKRVAPEIHKKFIEEYPQYDKEPNYIGKKIFVNSLKPNTKFVEKNTEWIFDGEFVRTANFDIGLSSPWWRADGDKADVKIKVNEKMTIEVNDNSIVDENTRFA